MNFWIPSVIANNQVAVTMAALLGISLGAVSLFSGLKSNNSDYDFGAAFKVMVVGIVFWGLHSVVNLVPSGSMIVEWSVDQQSRVSTSVQPGPLIHVGLTNFEIIPDQVCWNGKVLEINEQFNGEYLQEFLVRLSSLKSQGVNGVGFWDLNQSWMNATWFRPPYINVSESVC